MQSLGRCIDIVPAEGYALHPAIRTIGKELVKYRSHRPQESEGPQNTRKTADSRAVNKRSMLGTAVGNGPSAVDHPQQHQPRDSPANCYINGDAGGAVGIQ